MVDIDWLLSGKSIALVCEIHMCLLYLAFVYISTNYELDNGYLWKNCIEKQEEM